jgi:ribonuclease G
MKKNRIILSTTVNEIRVALVEDGELREFFIERADIERMVGNIYKGRVVSVHTGLKAAFVDIGARKSAFLPLSEVSEESDFEIDEDFSSESEKLPIESGKEILVQVVKDPLGSKGARVTSNISIPGKFLVLTPMNNRIAISRRISSRKERNRLKKLVRKNKPKDKGFIIRTAAAGKKAKDFKTDVKNLLRLWAKIKKKALKKEKKNVPSLIHEDAELIIRLMRDIFSEDINEVIVDSRDVYKKVIEYVNLITPGMVKKVKFYKGRLPIFKSYKIQQETDTMLNRRVKLKSGGYIIIEPTEALVAIDVNSGKSATDSEAEKLALTTNLEAADEIAKQLRLRDIGGIIVVDFIDMEDEKHRKKVVSVFKKAMRNDRARYRVLDISNIGLMEMTRKRISPGISQTFYEICPVCEGKGRILSKVYMAMKVIRGFESNVKSLEGKSVTIYGNPRFIGYFSSEFADTLSRFAKKYRISICLKKDNKVKGNKIKIFDNDKLSDITDGILP